MKKLNVILALSVITLALPAQVTNYLQVTINKGQLEGFCNLGGTDTVYMHSGLGTTDATSVWEHVVGHWGQADGIGKMTKIADSTYQICINIRDYYTNLASADSLHGGEGTGPMPNGATPYNIGVVFRNEGPCPVTPQGEINCIEGKDQNCKDIFILDLPSGNPLAYNQAGDPFPAVTARYVSGCAAAVRDISATLFGDIKVYPNPFCERLDFEFNMVPDVRKVSVELFDAMGAKVADFSERVRGGYNSFTWVPRQLPTGAYVLKVSNGSATYSKRIIKN